MQYEFLVSKNRLVLDCYEQQNREYETAHQEKCKAQLTSILRLCFAVTEIVNVTKEIHKLKNELEEAKIKRKQEEEYESLIRIIQGLPSREESQKYAEL